MQWKLIFVAIFDELQADFDELPSGSHETAVEFLEYHWKLVNFQVNSGKPTAFSHDFCLKSLEL
jgi:hypothetical protein